ncbi:hypothetical protein J6524_18615 [Bradyrhizobium sp. WSM 1738]|uniref:hypothetical protein n=1 Tax=Bradyrhizobium hereditatis TaxID=2821405 RepID=UPI001CE35E93|nr:hypothetical protein [Bradyrhizobium hereditatis]MCA6116881.1 hypothetical protein [Bradyrhizobium hereditatis]
MSNKAGFANGSSVTPYPKMEHGADRGEGLHEKTKSTATRPSRGNDLVRHMVADAGGERRFGVTLADLDINVRIVPSHRLDARRLPTFN